MVSLQGSSGEQAGFVCQRGQMQGELGADPGGSMFLLVEQEVIDQVQYPQESVEFLGLSSHPKDADQLPECP